MRRFVAPLVALAVALALAGGCTTAPVAGTSPAAPDSKPTISASAIAYAERIGGKPHEGETLYLVIITQDPSESVVTRRLSQAEPHFGDVANYFVVLQSGWFPELRPGEFVLAEAHASNTAGREALAWWEGRVEDEWYRPTVQRVTVATASPIPVVYVDVEHAP